MHGLTNLFLAAVAFTQLVPCNCQEGGQWQELAPISSGPLQEHTTVRVSSAQLAVLGGLAGGISTTDSVLLYDIPSDSWTSVAPLPVAMHHPNAVAIDGKIYVLGGLTGTSPWEAIVDTWVYDPAADSWESLEPIPEEQARGSAAMGVDNNTTIYLAGGIAGSATVGEPSLDTVSAFDVAMGTWIPLPEQASQIPGPRDHVGGAVVDNKFYVLGGRDSGITNVKDTVFVLDFENIEGGWTTREATMPTPRGGLSVAAVDGKIYTFGGEGNPTEGSQGVFDQAEAYDTETDTWSTLAPMNVPRHGTAAAEIAGKIYIPGGAVVQASGAVDTFEAFSP